MKHIFSLLILTFMLSVNSQIVLLNEGFENGIPNTWTNVFGSGAPSDFADAKYDSAWISIAENDTSASNRVAASSSYFGVPNTANNFLISPKVTLTGTQNQLTFWAKSRDGANPDKLLVMIGSDSISDNFSDTLIQTVFVPNYWYEFTVDIDNSVWGGQDVFFAFNLNTNDGFELQLDSIYVWDNTTSSVVDSDLDVSISPNPTVNEVNIQTESSLLEWKLYSSSGQELSCGNSVKVDLTGQLKGIYFLSILTANKEVVVRKIVKL